MAFSLPTAASASMADVNDQLGKAAKALSKTKRLKRDLRYDRAAAQLERAVSHTHKAGKAAGRLSGAKAKRANRKVAAQQASNAFVAVQLANSATALAQTQTPAIAELIERTLDLIDDVLVGGIPGSMLGPGGTISWPGLLNLLPRS